jgi:hypothetical protein
MFRSCKGVRAVSTFRKGDEGEQIIANVLLAAMVSQLHSEAAAGAYVEYAYALAKSLAQRSVTYRPLQPSKFAQLSLEVDGKIGTLLVSVINDSLVVPTPDRLKPNLLRTPGPIKFVDIELVRFMLRLRTRRIVAALETVRTAISQGALFRTVEYLLTECLREEVRSPDPLDRVSDCFTLAHDLVGKKNYPLAALLLNSAGSALDVYSKSSQVPDHCAIVHSMKGEIGNLLRKMGQTAS